MFENPLSAQVEHSSLVCWWNRYMSPGWPPDRPHCWAVEITSEMRWQLGSLPGLLPGWDAHREQLRDGDFCRTGAGQSTFDNTM